MQQITISSLSFSVFSGITGVFSDSSPYFAENGYQDNFRYLGLYSSTCQVFNISRRLYFTSDFHQIIWIGTIWEEDCKNSTKDLIFVAFLWQTMYCTYKY